MQDLKKKSEENKSIEKKYQQKEEECLKYKSNINTLETQLNSLKSYNLQLRALIDTKNPEENKIDSKQLEEL